MRFIITCDANEESGVGEIVEEISGPTRKHFVAKDYGVGLHGLGVILMCRDPELNFKRRIRLSKKEKILYMDIMLNFDQMKQIEHKERKEIIVSRILTEVPTILQKYSISDFDKEYFVNDLKDWFK